MHLVRTLIILLVASVFFACEFKKPDKERTPIAEVEGKFLYLDQLEGIVPAGASENDSVELVESYIRKWATDILLYETAKRNITDKAEIESLLDDYRKSLIIHQYQQNILNQRLNQQPSDEEISQFYNECSDQFVLKEALVKGMFLVLPVGAPKIDQVKKWMRKGDIESMEEIEKYCLQHGLSYDYFADTWLPLNEILKKSNVAFETSPNAIQEGKIHEVSDSLRHYLLSVDSIRRTGDIEPYELAESKISYLIMNQVKSEFFRNFENELYRDAKKDGTISFFK